MSEARYPYTKSPRNEDQLQGEIVALSLPGFFGLAGSGSTVEVLFTAPLSTPNEAILAAAVAAHVPLPADTTDNRFRTNYQVVRSLSYFPAPVAGVITLADDTCYEINGAVDIGTNRIVCGTRNTIRGLDRQNDVLISSTPGAMFTMDNSAVSKASLIFDTLTLRATAGTLISAFGGVTPNQVTFITTTINQTLNGGTFSNIVFSMRTSSLSAFSVNGFVFSGANTALTFRDSSATNNVGTVFDLTGATLSVVRISRNSITTGAGNTFLNATGTAITLASNVALNIFTGASASYLVGVSGATPMWLFTSNQGVTNTKAPVTDLALPGGSTNFLREDGTWQPAGGGGSTTYTPFTRDLDAARSSGTFDITGLSGLTADKPVLVVQSAAPIASKGNARDEPEMDRISATGYVLNATTIRVYWHASAVVVGEYAFAYLVSA